MDWMSKQQTRFHWTSNQVGPRAGSRSELWEFTHVPFDLVIPCTGVLLGWDQHLEWLHSDKHRHFCSGRRAGVLGVCLGCVGHSVGLGRVLWERGAVHRLAQGNPCFRLSRLASHPPPHPTPQPLTHAFPLSLPQSPRCLRCPYPLPPLQVLLQLLVVSRGTSPFLPGPVRPREGTCVCTRGWGASPPPSGAW